MFSRSRLFFLFIRSDSSKHKTMEIYNSDIFIGSFEGDVLLPVELSLTCERKSLTQHVQLLQAGTFLFALSQEMQQCHDIEICMDDTRSRKVVTLGVWHTGYPFLHDVGTIKIEPQLLIGYEPCALDYLQSLQCVPTIAILLISLGSFFLLVGKRLRSATGATQASSSHKSTPKKRRFNSTEQYFDTLPPRSQPRGRCQQDTGTSNFNPNSASRVPAVPQPQEPAARNTITPSPEVDRSPDHSLKALSRDSREDSFTSRLFGDLEPLVVDHSPQPQPQRRPQQAVRRAKRVEV